MNHMSKILHWRHPHVGLAAAGDGAGGAEIKGQLQQLGRHAVEESRHGRKSFNQVHDFSSCVCTELEFVRITMAEKKRFLRA